MGCLQRRGSCPDLSQDETLARRLIARLGSVGRRIHIRTMNTLSPPVIRTWLIRMTCAFIAFVMTASWSVAQVPNQAPPPAAPAGGGTGMLIRPLWTEIAITVIFLGLALFAVCRSSNRS